MPEYKCSRTIEKLPLQPFEFTNEAKTSTPMYACPVPTNKRGLQKLAGSRMTHGDRTHRNNDQPRLSYALSSPPFRQRDICRDVVHGSTKRPRAARKRGPASPYAAAVNSPGERSAQVINTYTCAIQRSKRARKVSWPRLYSHRLVTLRSHRKRV